WEWAVKPNDREKASFLKDNILPIQEGGQLHWINSSATSTNNALDLTEWLPLLSMRFVDGYTESMMLPQITYKGHQIVYMADLLPSIGHIPLPYVMAYDMFPLTTLGEKKSFLQEALHNNYILFFEHDPAHECCRLVSTEKGIRAGDTFKLSEI